MPFLRGDDWNYRRRGLRIYARTRPSSREIDSPPRGNVAQLIRFECGDLAWEGRHFIAWGEACTFLNLIDLGYGHSERLDMSIIDTRRVHWTWISWNGPLPPIPDAKRRRRK